MAQQTTLKLYLIRTGRTTWEEQSRVDSTAGAPLTDDGAKSVRDTAAQLATQSIGMIYAGSGEAERQTAGLLAEALGVKVKALPQLRELDYGLWQGLTHEEIKRRNPKVYRCWSDSPASVRPPDGETLAEARQRLIEAADDILKRSKGTAVLLVLRPVVLALLRGALRGGDPDELWKNVDQDLTWCSFEINGNIL